MSAADKLRDLHARSQYQSGVSMTNSLAVQQDACITAASLLPDIIAVIAAAEWVRVYSQEDVGTTPWFESHEKLADALAALNARLTNTRDGGEA